MSNKTGAYILWIVCGAAMALYGCNSTRHLKDGQYLLNRNTVKFTQDEYLDNKATVADNLDAVIAQQPNSSFMFSWLRIKLFLYNLRYDKYEQNKGSYQVESRTVEPPVIYDSTTIAESKRYMEAHLFHQGYFYAKITDTTILNKKRKKANVVYTIDPGFNYVIKRVFFTGIEDSSIRRYVQSEFSKTELRAGRPYAAGLLEQERVRISDILRDKGYYYFANSNVSFQLDTLVDKKFVKTKESVLGEAADLVTFKKEQARPTLDIYVNITNSEDGKAFKQYGINRVIVFPDYVDRNDARDSTMTVKKIENTTIRYHNYYIRPKVLHNHIFINSNGYFSQSDYDKTITELNQLGVFESVRGVFFEDTARKDGGVDWLSCAFIMSRARKYDLNLSWEASTGTTYALGSGATLSLSSKNIGKGANLLTTSINVGLESQFDSVADNFFILTRTAGINSSLEFPKFLFPISKERYSIRNTPRTEVAVGANLLDRVNFFMLTNLTSRFTYKWRETSTKSWEVSPFFVNDIALPRIDPLFKARLDTNEYLRNTYRETFIEGENITWTFSNANQAAFFDDYSYIKLGIEEAGGLVGGLNKISPGLTASYAQYVRLDYDIRHYIKQRHATTALRLYGGVGLPYGQSITLPYLKQYFVGGPFSMRGWRIRTLGPGTYTNLNIDLTNSRASALIDRTGDIKIEMNGEYRFEIFKLFGSVLQFNGALFADAGNIWLSKKSESYPGGEFALNKLYDGFAVDGGAGIRVDIASLFVLRIDWAVPLKVPGKLDIPERNIKQGWILDDIDPLYDRWRRSIVWNVAIGYPF